MKKQCYLIAFLFVFGFGTNGQEMYQDSPLPGPVILRTHLVTSPSGSMGLAPDKKATRQAPALKYDEFGGQYAIGLGFGDGLMGNFRYSLSPKTALEAGLGYGSTIVPIENSFLEDDNPFNTESNVQIEGAAHLMGVRHINPKGKIKAKGIMLRITHLFGNFATTSFSAGYGIEVFNPNKKKPTRSYIFEIGLKAGLPHWDTNAFGLGKPPAAFPYLRFRWFWYQ